MRFFISILIFSFNFVSFSQDRMIAGFFPETGLNFKINDRMGYLLKIESQHELLDNTSTFYPAMRYSHVLTEVQSFFSYKLTYTIKGAVGYQYRFASNRTNSHRSIQQIAWVNNFRKFRLGSRIRTDQTFSSTESPEFRMRYRAATDIPLQGERLDNGEKYLIVSNEFIGSLQSNAFNLENRFVAGIGHYFDSSKKLELSLDYRTDPYFPSVDRHRIWLKISYYWNIEKFFSIN